MFKRVLIAVCAALLVGAVAPSAVLAAPASSYAELDAQEARDKIVVLKAMADFQQRGPSGLAKHLRTLEKVLAEAPESYPVVETRGEVTITRYEDAVPGALEAALGVVGPVPTDGPKTVHVQPRTNVYGLAAWMLAWAAVEARDPNRAIKALDTMLARQPNNPMLVGEKGAALNQLERWQESHDVYDGALKSGFPMSPQRRAVMLRGRGFSLIELHRYDEAEADYRESLKLEPNHGGALNELAYIQTQRAGQDRVKPDTFTADEARDMGKDAPDKPK